MSATAALYSTMVDTAESGSRTAIQTSSNTRINGVRKKPAPSTSTSTSAHMPSQSELKACLDILAKLQPRIEARIPTLYVVPPKASNVVPAKRKLDEAVDHGPEMSRQFSTDKEPLSDAPSTSAPPKRKPFRLKRSGSIGSNANASIRPMVPATVEAESKLGTSTSRSRRRSSGQSSRLSQDAAAAATADLVSDDHISPLAALPSPAEAPKVVGADGDVTTLHRIIRHPPALAIQDWPPEKFRKLSGIARQQATVLKRSGDNKMREIAMQQQQIHQQSRRDTPGTGSAMPRSKSRATLSPDKPAPLSLPTSFPTGMSPSVPAFFEHVDAIVLYAFGFWADDYAAGQYRVRSASVMQATPSNADSWRIGCIVENWRSMFGLLTFVKTKAEKFQAQAIATVEESRQPASKFDTEWPRIIELLVAWLNMVEALILQHTSHNLSRQLLSQTRGLMILNGGNVPSGPSPPGGDTESIASSHSMNQPTSSNGTSNIPRDQADNFFKQYIRMQGEMERVHTLWPASQAVFMHKGAGSSDVSTTSRSPGAQLASKSTEEDALTRTLRRGRTAYDREPTNIDALVVPTLPYTERDSIRSPEDLFKDEECYYQFAWPVLLHHQNAIAHAASFGRALLFEASEKLGVGYTPGVIDLRDVN